MIKHLRPRDLHGVMLLFCRNRGATAGIILVGLLIVLAICGPSVLQDPQHQDLSMTYQAPSRRHPLGTDDRGRDLLARMVTGSRISLRIGFGATAVALCIGTLYGMAAGYSGGIWDEWMMRQVDVMYSLPYMFLVIFFMATFDMNVAGLCLLLGLTSWMTIARVTRGEVLRIKARPYVEAARSSGSTHLSILFRHILPNILPVTIVYTTLTVPAIMLQEAFLSFLGLTVKGQEHSWGKLLYEAMGEINPVTINWWMVLFPCVGLGIVFLALNFMGDGLRDVLDPRMRAVKGT